MVRTRVNTAWMWAGVFIVVPGVLLLGLFGQHFFSSGVSDSPQERFLRAAYVLQMMEGTAPQVGIRIPDRVRLADATESLLHHPDKLFVLKSLAVELSQLRHEGIRDAALYEAFARIDLGETEAARALLMSYVADHSYQPELYALLCSLLEKQRDYGTLMVICSEWKERDPRPLEERIIYSWKALCGLGNFFEAWSLMLREGSGLGWKQYMYAARAAKAAGRADEEEKLLFQASQAPGYAPATAASLYQTLLPMEYTYD